MGATADSLIYSLKTLSTVDDIVDAWNTQDASKFAASYAAGVLVAFVSGMAIASVGAVSWPLVAAVAVLGAFANVFISEAFDTILEDVFQFDHEPEDIAKANGRWVFQMVSGGVGARLPHLGDFVEFAAMDGDVLHGQSAVSNFLIGGAGDDLIYGNLLSDRLSGGGGSDHLLGYSGSDILKGGAGDDTLEGGLGDDQLEGGVGFDVYKFSTLDLSNPGSRDVIYDEDGNGVIKFNGLDISGTGIGFDNIRHASLGAWETSDGSFRLAVIGAGTSTQSLLIIRIGVGSQILVKEWKNGDLGITLPGFDQQVAEIAGTLTGGDDLFGEVGSNSGNDIVNGLGGNDGIDGGAGDDYLDGGTGHDLILGGAGNDHIFGGDGDDHIFDGSERANLREWTSTERDQADYDIQNNLGAGTLLARGESWYVVQGGPLDGVHAPQWIYQDPDLHPGGDDFIDAGAGNDRVFAGEGNDIVLGGSGDDYLNGGHDDDTIHGGEGNDIIEGDVTADSLPGVHLTRAVSAAARINGDDVLDGGAGDDIIRGGGGNDIIYGGDGRLPNGAPNFGSRSFPRRRKSLFLVEGKSDFHLCRNGERCRHRRNNRRFVFLPLLYDEAAAGQREMGRRFIDAII